MGFPVPAAGRHPEGPRGPGDAARAGAAQSHRGGIPNFSEINVELKARTGFEVVAVPGLVPDEVFFNHLANRRFPAGQFIRTRAQLDYLQEPDIFHDVFGMCRC